MISIKWIYFIFGEKNFPQKKNGEKWTQKKRINQIILLTTEKDFYISRKVRNEIEQKKCSKHINRAYIENEKGQCKIHIWIKPQIASDSCGFHWEAVIKH